MIGNSERNLVYPIKPAAFGTRVRMEWNENGLTNLRLHMNAAYHFELPFNFHRALLQNILTFFSTLGMFIIKKTVKKR